MTFISSSSEMTKIQLKENFSDSKIKNLTEDNSAMNLFSNKLTCELTEISVFRGKFVKAKDEAHFTDMEGETLLQITLEKEDGKNVTLVPIDVTAYSKSISSNLNLSKGDDIYCIGVPCEFLPGVVLPMIITREEESIMFNNIPNLYAKAVTIKYFYEILDPENRQYILNRRRSEGTSKNALEDFNKFFDLLLLFKLTEEAYEPETQRIVKMLLGSSRNRYREVEEKLKYILSTTSSSVGPRNIDVAAFDKAINKAFCGRKNIKERIKELLLAADISENKGVKILLIGPSGTGKTALSKAISKAINRPFHEINLSALACPIEIEGLTTEYKDADAGRIAKAFNLYKSNDIVLVLDKVDEICRRSNEGDSMLVIKRLLKEDKISDKYIEAPVSINNTVIIATATDEAELDADFLSSFNVVIEMPSYSMDEIKEITYQSVLPGILSELKLRGVQLTEETIEYIYHKFCADSGMRDMVQNVKTIVRRLAIGASANKKDADKIVDVDTASNILSGIVKESPALYFKRHREEYDMKVAREIERCLQKCEKPRALDPDEFARAKTEEQLSILLACKDEKTAFLSDFSPTIFEESVHKELYGMNSALREVSNTLLLEKKKALAGNVHTQVNFAFVGGYGTGKTAFAKTIAKNLNYEFVQFSCGGLTHAQLKGFHKAVPGAEPGILAKAIKVAGHKRLLILFDEIDKLPEGLYPAIQELFDRYIHEEFLNVHVNLPQIILIATANDWSVVPAMLRDRTKVVYIEGYTHAEKAQITREYLVRRLEREIGAPITILDTAMAALLEYSKTFGVRDIEQNLTSVVAEKLRIEEENDLSEVIITKRDVKRALGPKPLLRGNLVEGDVIGVAKALAVTNMIEGIAFGIETVAFDDEKEQVEITGLPKEAAVDAVKVAKTYIKKTHPQLLRNQSLHVHFAEGAVPVEGPSAGTAICLSMLSALLDAPVPADIAITGELGLTGSIHPVGALKEKIQVAVDSGCKKIFIPKKNLERIDNVFLSQYDGCQIIGVNHMSEITRDVFPELYDKEDRYVSNF